MPDTQEHKNIMERLCEPLPQQYVKDLQGFDYEQWQMQFLVLTANLGYNWDYIVKEAKVEIHPEKSNKGKIQYFAQAIVSLILYLPDGTTVTREGTGADVKTDADNCLKTAQSNAFSKACMGIGRALYLAGFRNESLKAFKKGGDLHETDSEEPVNQEKVQENLAKLNEEQMKALKEELWKHAQNWDKETERPHPENEDKRTFVKLFLADAGYPVSDLSELNDENKLNMAITQARWFAEQGFQHPLTDEDLQALGLEKTS